MTKTNECISKKESFNLFTILNWGSVFPALPPNYEITGFQFLTVK